jgi:hypothetical protein
MNWKNDDDIFKLNNDISGLINELDKITGDYIIYANNAIKSIAKKSKIILLIL